MNNTKKLIASFLMFWALISNAQLKNGDLVDGISAVIGSEIVLQSDIEEQENYAKQQGAKVTNRCQFLERMISQELLYNYAKQDTLIQNRSKEIAEQSNHKFQQFSAGFPTEKEMLKSYNFRTVSEMKAAIIKMDTRQYYTQQKVSLITNGLDVSPNEVSDFYQINQLDFPEVKEEVVLAKIVRKPKLSESHKNELIKRLKTIKKDILAGATFDSKARIYSEDQGSASKGGLYTNINKGKMVKIFEATALNLQEGEISDPVESEFGFHIIQLEKKSGKVYDARHILLLAVPNKEEIAIAKKELDSIRTLIVDKKMTFKEAAFKFSEDKTSKFNAGIMVNEEGSDKLEKINLPSTITYHIAGLNKGDITDVFDEVEAAPEKEESKKLTSVMMIALNDTIPAHIVNLDSDYQRIKRFALQDKQNKKIEAWVKEKLPETVIKINDRFKDCNLLSKYK